MFKVIKSVFYDERRHYIMDNSEVIISKFDGIAALSIQLTTTIQHELPRLCKSRVIPDVVSLVYTSNSS